MRKKFYYFLMVLLMFHLIACSTNIISLDEERHYKRLATNFFSHAIRMEKIKVPYSHYTSHIDKDRKIEIAKIDPSKKLNYIKTHKKDLDKIRYALDDYIRNSNKSNKWHDDAMFCLAAFYLHISIEGNLLTEEAIQAYRELADLKNNIKIEEWTLDLFRKSYLKWLISDIPEEEWTKKLEIGERIYQYCKAIIVGELIKAKRYNEAREEYIRLKNDPSINKDNLLFIKEIINNIELYKSLDDKIKGRVSTININ